MVPVLRDCLADMVLPGHAGNRLAAVVHIRPTGYHMLAVVGLDIHRSGHMATVGEDIGCAEDTDLAGRADRTEE
jgi:hypothetical protein